MSPVCILLTVTACDCVSLILSGPVQPSQKYKNTEYRKKVKIIWSRLQPPPGSYVSRGIENSKKRKAENQLDPISWNSSSSVCHVESDLMMNDVMM